MKAMTSGRPKKERKITFEDLPESFKRSLIKFMSIHNITDVDNALELAGHMLDTNDAEFNKLVNSKFESYRRSEFMIGVNKGRATLEEKAKESGYYRGYNVARNQFEIRYRCSLCGKEITMYPNGEDYKKIVQYLFDNKWGHRQCVDSYNKR